MLPIGDDQDHDRAPIVNYALIALNALAFVAFCLPEPRPRVMELGALLASDVRPLTLFSHMFLHANLFHLLGNLLFLWIFGRLAEEYFGRAAYAAAYVLSGLGAAGLHLLTVRHPEVRAIGSSGAVSGAIGACLVFCPRANVRLLWWFFMVGTWMIPISLWALLWFVEQVYFASAGFAYGGGYYAHIGGFAAGAVLAWLWRDLAVRLRGPRRAPLESRDTAQPRRSFEPFPDDADAAFLDESIDAYAVVTLEDCGRHPRGVAARALPREKADALRRELQAAGVPAALIADQAANHPAAPQSVDAASWDDRVLRLRVGTQVVPVPWSAGFLALAADVEGETFVDLVLGRESAFRIRRAASLTRIDVRRRREEAADLAGLARDLEARRSGGNDEGVRALASGGAAPSASRAEFDDHVFRTYHLAKSGKAIRRA
jgi:membrane associated rhomboid family serine protease